MAADRGRSARAIVSVLAFGFSLWAVAGAGAETVFWGFLMLLAGVPVFALMRWRAPEPSNRGPAEQDGARARDVSEQAGDAR